MERLILRALLYIVFVANVVAPFTNPVPAQTVDAGKYALLALVGLACSARTVGNSFDWLRAKQPEAPPIVPAIERIRRDAEKGAK